jgi:hypothetical protein
MSYARQVPGQEKPKRQGDGYDSRCGYKNPETPQPEKPLPIQRQ